MQSKIALKRPLVIASIVGIAFSIVVISSVADGMSVKYPFGYPRQSDEASDATSPAGQTSVGLPIRLKIPRINVDAAVESVGFTADGAMDIPKDPATVAWFSLGPSPGENGSAVMSGHFGWKDAVPAVFDGLSTLRKGDTIQVTDDRGVVTTFLVRELRTYDAKANAGDVFASNDGKVHLNLITCEGVWDKVSKSYSERLVVFTDMEAGLI